MTPNSSVPVSPLPTPSLAVLSWALLDMTLCFLFQVAARKHREIHDVQHSKKMVTFITCEITFGQHVRELIFGVNIFDLDPGFQIGSVEQPIKGNSVGS